MTLQTAKIDRDKFIYFVSKHLLRRNRFGAFRNGVPCNRAPVAWPQPTPKNYDNHMPQPHLGSSLVKDIVAQISRSKIDFLLNYIGSYSQYLSQLLAWRKPNEHVFKLMAFNVGWDQVGFLTLVVHWSIACLSLKYVEWVHGAHALSQYAPCHSMFA